MSKWKIQHEEFDDRTPTGRRRWHKSDEERAKHGDRVRHSNEQVIAEFKEVWGDRYDYSKVDHNSNSHKIKLTIICREHGEFLQLRSNHRKGQQGCKECLRIERRQAYDALSPEEKAKRNAGKVAHNQSRAKSHIEFRPLFEEIWGDRYDYSQVPETFARDAIITVICRKCGGFETTPLKHTGARNDRAPRGCPKCRDGYGTGLLKEKYLSKYDIPKISRLVDEGLSLKQISKELDLSVPTVRKIVELCCSS